MSVILTHERRRNLNPLDFQGNMIHTFQAQHIPNMISPQTNKFLGLHERSSVYTDTEILSQTHTDEHTHSRLSSNSITSGEIERLTWCHESSHSIYDYSVYDYVTCETENRESWIKICALLVVYLGYRVV